MQNFWFKDYYIMFDRNHNGSISAFCSGDFDHFGVTFYDYTMREIRSRIKHVINDRGVTA